jgi:hypothetical protein
MEFQIGLTYSRRVISAKLGGSIRTSLPVSSGTVVCGCFKKAPRWNPGAPEEITLGVKPRVHAAARKLLEQGSSIPLFLFKEDAAWEYIGDYRCTGYSKDRRLCEQKMKENPIRGVIGGVLYLEKA